MTDVSQIEVLLTDIILEIRKLRQVIEEKRPLTDKQIMEVLGKDD